MCLGAALAGLAGTLAAPYFSVQPGMGQAILITVLIVVVVGGIGSIGGAMVAGLGARPDPDHRQRLGAERVGARALRAPDRGPPVAADRARRKARRMSTTTVDRAGRHPLDGRARGHPRAPPPIGLTRTLLIRAVVVDGRRAASSGFFVPIAHQRPVLHGDRRRRRGARHPRHRHRLPGPPLRPHQPRPHRLLRRRRLRRGDRHDALGLEPRSRPRCSPIVGGTILAVAIGALASGRPAWAS